MSALRYLDDVVTLRYDVAKCTGCGQCAMVCPRGVFVMEDGRARLVDRDACIECGACSLNCDFAAIEVRPGVGCAAGVIQGWFRGGEPTCGGGEDDPVSSGGCCG
jgi:ferredoxin